MKNPKIFFEDFLPSSLLEGLGMSLPSGTVVAFHVEGLDGGDWQVMKTRDATTVTPVDQTPKDCEMWCTAETFMRIVSGGIRSSRAFLSGDLRIAGDIGLALKMETILREAA